MSSLICAARQEEAAGGEVEEAEVTEKQLLSEAFGIEQEDCNLWWCVCA